VSATLYFDSIPLVGWRAWAIVDSPAGLELRSLVYAHTWPAREPLQQECEAGGCLAARWPAQPHSCGIHAFKQRADAVGYPATWEARRTGFSVTSDEYVIGQVSLWGRVIEHERGFRAQFAYPYALFLAPAQQRFRNPLATRYGVEVEIDDRRGWAS
jgi:hypothetical protein